MTERLHELVTQQALRIADLEAQVARLEDRTSDDASRLKLSSTAGDIVEHHCRNDNRIPAYERLIIEHELLQARHRKCEARIAKATRAYAQAKAKVLEWNAYAQRQISKRDKHVESSHLTKPLSDFGVLNESRSTSTAKDGDGALRITPPAELHGHESHEDDQSSIMPEPHKRALDPAQHFGSSQSTIPEQATSQTCLKRGSNDIWHNEHESMAITHVSTKRRRLAWSKAMTVKREPSATPEPILVSSDGPDKVNNCSVRDSGTAEQTISSGLDRNRTARKQQHRRDTSLRSLPLEALQLDHFKLNPRFTGPYLRSLDPNANMVKRRCPPGCRRAECCGGRFRKVVELGGVQVSARSDEEVLREYIGPRWRKIMASYEPERRKDVLIHAHAVSFAGTTHMRETNHDRATTPPGFWRIEMSSTQENAEDVVQAKDMERTMVKERWQEAMRANGRWIFRDES